MALSAAFIGTSGYQTKIEDVRQLTKALFGSNSGRLGATSFTVTPTASALSVDISAGQAYVVGTSNTSQGGYFVWNDVTQTIPWTLNPSGVPALTSGQTRIDTLLLQVADSQYGVVTTTDGPQWLIAPGTPGTPGTAPVAPYTGIAQAGAYVPWANVLVSYGDLSFTSGDITPLAGAVGQTTASTGVVAYIQSGVIWPTNGTDYINTTESLVGSAVFSASAGVLLKKTFTVLANRMYEVTCEFSCIDGNGQCAAEIAIRRSAVGVSTVVAADTKIAQKRVATINGTSTDGGFGSTITGYMNGLTAGTYTVGAFMHRVSSNSADRVRLVPSIDSPAHCYKMLIKDIGPSIVEG